MPGTGVRNVTILSISQALSVAGASMVILLGGVIGGELAPSRSWATLPIAAMIVGQALATVPAALLMKRIGRRRGFVAAAAGAAGAALLAAYGVAQSSFVLFCAGTLLLGAAGAFVQQYRFAASESVEPRYSGRAISFLLFGGMAAGFLGPEVARNTQNWLAAGQYTGSFVSLALLNAVALGLLLFFREPGSPQAQASREERPLKTIITQPTYLVAVLAAATAYGLMSSIMTATPIHLHAQHGYSLDQTARVIQGHIMAMYLPSLLTGFLLERLGLFRVMVLGVAALTACVVLAMVSRELLQYAAALILLGIGWNLLFVGGTVLLTRSYRQAERFKSQAVNDLAVFGVQAFASLAAGTMLFYANWDTLNLLSVPLLAVTLLAVLLLRGQMAAAGTSHAGPGVVSPSEAPTGAMALAVLRVNAAPCE